tara:strand:+ start:157 stop:381 length:225 start_codon:yes stop_codon:yes gene_type:complete
MRIVVIIYKCKEKPTITEKKMTNDEILYLVDRAYLVGFDIHKITNMIRKGSTMEECIHALKENVQAAFMTFPEQ